MKKFLKFGAALTALVLGLACLAACSDGEESRSVVAKYQAADYTSKYYIFYSDGTYEYKENTIVMEKGEYRNSPLQRGTVTILPQELFDMDSEMYIQLSFSYIVKIVREGDDFYLDYDGETFFIIQ